MFFFTKSGASRIVVVGCLALTNFIAGTALAADAMMQAPEAQVPVAKFDERRWKVIVSPYVWAASLKGKTEVAGRSADVDVPFSETIENLDFSIMGNIDVTNGLFGMYFDGQYTKTSQKEDLRNFTLGAGFTVTTLSAGAFFRAIEMPLGGENVFGNQRVFAIEPTAGVRWTQLKADFTLDRWAESRKLEWTDPFVGVRINTDLSERWNLFAMADVGGFGVGTDLSAQGQAYLGYRTHIFNQPALLRLGYRALYQDYEGGDILGQKFKWNVTQHGPLVGLSLVF